MNIFNEIDEDKRKTLLDCLRAVKKSYKKNEIIFDETSTLKSVGYILNGRINIYKDDYAGNKIIISDFKTGETFGESIICAPEANNIKICGEALENTEILFLNFSRILNTCQNSCPFHKKLIENIIKVIAHKNLLLQEKIELLSKKSLRQRILHFLYTHNSQTNDLIFSIPYTREQMASLLSTNRSALSRELSKMKTSGILDYHKNSFKFLNN